MLVFKSYDVGIGFLAFMQHGLQMAATPRHGKHSFCRVWPVGCLDSVGTPVAVFIGLNDDTEVETVEWVIGNSHAVCGNNSSGWGSIILVVIVHCQQFRSLGIVAPCTMARAQHNDTCS